MTDDRVDRLAGRVDEIVELVADALVASIGYSLAISLNRSMTERAQSQDHAHDAIGRLRGLGSEAPTAGGRVDWECGCNGGAGVAHSPDEEWCSVCGVTSPYVPAGSVAPTSTEGPARCGSCGHRASRHEREGGCSVCACLVGAVTPRGRVTRHDDIPAVAAAPTGAPEDEVDRLRTGIERLAALARGWGDSYAARSTVRRCERLLAPLAAGSTGAPEEPAEGDEADLLRLELAVERGEVDDLAVMKQMQARTDLHEMTCRKDGAHGALCPHRMGDGSILLLCTVCDWNQPVDDDEMDRARKMVLLPSSPPSAGSPVPAEAPEED